MLKVISKFGWASKIAAVAAVLMTSLPAHAVSLSPGDDVIRTFDLETDSTASFAFEPSGNLLVSIISAAGSGFSQGEDLAKVLFGVNGADTNFTTFSDNNRTSSAGGMLPSFFVSTPFTLDFSAIGTAKTVGITATLVAEEVPVVPLPASGLMFGSLLLLGAGGVAARRYLK